MSLLDNARSEEYKITVGWELPSGVGTFKLHDYGWMESGLCLSMSVDNMHR